MKETLSLSRVLLSVDLNTVGVCRLAFRVQCGREKNARTHTEREDNNEVLLMSVGRRRRRRSLSSRMTNLFKHTIDVKTNFSSSLARSR